jgi:hypothetical protein
MRGRFVIALFLCVSAAAAPDCAGCHPREAAEYATSAHAHSLQKPAESNFYKSLPGVPIGEARGGFLLNYRLDGAALRVNATRGPETAAASIKWVFGAGRQAETPVAVAGQALFEHRISYYRENGRFGLTIGQQGGVSSSPRSALGRQLDPDEAKRCFGCHASAGLPDDPAFTPGISCERCHAGAAEHAKGSGSVFNPGRLKARALIEFCAACHRDQPEGNPDARINIRYQAVQLMRSACFRNGGLSCVTCHDPHANVKSDASFYRERCLTCHQDQKNQGDCLECHMARSSPLPHLTFTDHDIRVRSSR